jgi:prevent-host-death family protein
MDRVIGLAPLTPRHLEHPVRLPVVSFLHGFAVISKLILRCTSCTIQPLDSELEKKRMMATMNVAEARRQFSELVARVAYTGERVVIERRGKPMMALVSIEDLQRLERLVDAQEPVRQQRRAGLEQARALREEIRKQGAPRTDVVEDIYRLREERDRELSGLCFFIPASWLGGPGNRPNSSTGRLSMTAFIWR